MFQRGVDISNRGGCFKEGWIFQIGVDISAQCHW